MRKFFSSIGNHQNPGKILISTNRKLVRILIKSCFDSCQDLEIPWLHVSFKILGFLERFLVQK
jgi:hypothetical protein